MEARFGSRPGAVRGAGSDYEPWSCVQAQPCERLGDHRRRQLLVSHQSYGGLYEVEPVPGGLTRQELRDHLGRMSWYHAIDFGHGVVSPGMKPLEVIDREWRMFGFDDLSSSSLLDIGGVDGAYAFRAERAGASPVAVLDHYVWSIDPDAYGRLYRRSVEAGTTPPAPHETDLWDPDRLPGRWRFDTARQLLGSRVQALAGDFMDCDLAAVGTWDIVLFLGVLYHMEDPLRALRRVFAVTRRQAIIETEAVVIPGHPEPLWRFFPHGELNHDRTNWWAPNLGALLGLVGAAGFGDAEILSGEPLDIAEASGEIRHYRAIVRAIKR
jgi:tRNA (mo5U34)-methyltransferase